MARSNGSPNQVDGPDGVDAVMATSRALVAALSKSLAPAENVVSVSQWRALVVIAEEGEVSLNQLAVALGVHASTATRICDRLIAEGLMTREPYPHDRRYLTLTPTPKGRRLVDRVMAARRREITRILDQLAPASRRRVATAFGEFARAAGEPQPPGAF